jgi:hypothetical protein
MLTRLASRIVSICMTVGLVESCASAPPSQPPIRSSTTSNAITDEMIGRRFPAMPLKAVATNPSYGYSAKVPIAVGGGFGEGSHNVYRYLNRLMGPHQQVVHYNRVGTCCEFKTANSPFDGKALLEVYEISYDGAGAPVRLYFNWYDAGAALLPLGLTARPD